MSQLYNLFPKFYLISIALQLWRLWNPSDISRLELALNVQPGFKSVLMETFIGVDEGLFDREVAVLILVQEFLNEVGGVHNTQFGIFLVGQLCVTISGSRVVRSKFGAWCRKGGRKVFAQDSAVVNLYPELPVIRPHSVGEPPKAQYPPCRTPTFGGTQRSSIRVRVVFLLKVAGEDEVECKVKIESISPRSLNFRARSSARTSAL